jgi:hypothetical protein
VNCLRPVVLVLAAVLTATACGAGSAPFSPSPSGSGGILTVPEMKIALLDRFGELWFCDPDEYPVPRGDEAEQARLHFPEIAADEETLQAIVDWIETERIGAFTPEQQLHIYQAWKILNAIELVDAGGGRFRFEILTKSAQSPEGGLRTVGTIDRAGTIEVQAQRPDGEPACPICLARGVRIDTPSGPVAIETLRTGALVWSLDRRGRRIPARILRTGSSPVPADHRVVRLALADGRSVTASPGHPLADGRRMRELSVGDLVDGSPVVATALEPYRGTRTFDILPAGGTGAYWAGGVLLGSTIAG